MATLKVVPEAVRREDGDYVVTLRAPGKQVNDEHPAAGPLPQAMNWLAAVRRHMHEGMSLYEADEAARAAMVSHDGKGRKFQPSALR
jgi:hypothetical protein